MALLVRNTRIPANSQMAVHVKLSEFSNDKVLMLEPLGEPSGANCDDLHVARTLIRSAGQKRLAVLNLSDKTIFLRKNTPVAAVSRVEDIVANLSEPNNAESAETETVGGNPKLSQKGIHARAWA